VLQEQEFERVGGTTPIRVDVRIIATTNRDLAAEAAAGRFRQDLYYRLSVIPLRIPPLRERIDDIPLLALRFAMRTAAELKKEIVGLTPDAIDLLQRYPWPGNVRELQHAVERAVILSTESSLGTQLFEGQRFGLMTPRLEGAPIVAAAQARFGSTGMMPNGNGSSGHAPVVLHSLDIDEAEQALIARALEVSGGNRTRAADMLGINVRTLRNKLNGKSDVAS
jgi:DNA-binding NtrC family response regulator